jgi:hypothetical protein
MAACSLEYDKIQTISASASASDGFHYYGDDDDDNVATSRKTPAANKASSVSSGSKKMVSPFLTSSLGANFDPPGRSCPQGVNFVP